MSHNRTLPRREFVFAGSLRRHGFRLVTEQTYLKLNKAYLLPTTKQEDASMIDFLSSLLAVISGFRSRLNSEGLKSKKDFSHLTSKDKKMSPS